MQDCSFRILEILNSNPSNSGFLTAHGCYPRNKNSTHIRALQLFYSSARPQRHSGVHTGTGLTGSHTTVVSLCNTLHNPLETRFTTFNLSLVPVYLLGPVVSSFPSGCNTQPSYSSFMASWTMCVAREQYRFACPRSDLSLFLEVEQS